VWIVVGTVVREKTCDGVRTAPEKIELMMIMIANGRFTDTQNFFTNSLPPWNENGKTRAAEVVEVIGDLTRITANGRHSRMPGLKGSQSTTVVH
jgi:hypothetical protein